MILVVGLGNPGLQYESNRHNVGFIIIDKIKNRKEFPNFTKKFNSEISKRRIEGIDIILLKPLTYMNASGDAVLQCKNFFKIPNNNIFVIHDDLDMDFLKVRIKDKGSHGGHNGIKDIIKLLGDKFIRLKIGVRNKSIKDAKNFVLEDFLKDEKADFDLLAENIVNNLLDLLSKRFSKFLNNLKG